MKRGLKGLSASLCLGAIIAVSIVPAACGTSGDDPAYVVSFTLDGTHYELTGGYTDDNVFYGTAVGSQRTSQDTIRIAAVDESVSDMITEGPVIAIAIDGIVAGTYNLAGDGMAGTDGGQLAISVDGTVKYYDKTGANDLALILVSSPAAVGGAIEGSFSGTLWNGAGTISVIIENGYFYVERIDDDAIQAPFLFS